MASNKISQTEANRLLNMVKRTIVSEISFPSKGKEEEFNVVGDSKQNVFSVNILEGKLIASNII